VYNKVHYLFALIRSYFDVFGPQVYDGSSRLMRVIILSVPIKDADSFRLCANEAFVRQIVRSICHYQSEKIKLLLFMKYIVALLLYITVRIHMNCEVN
jgi:hypothetical protein